MDEWREIFDLERIAVLRELDRDSAPGLLREMIRLFLTEGPERLERIRRALAEGDRKRVRQEAHLLGGGAANFGAFAGCELAAALEMWAKEESKSDPSGIYNRLEEEYGRMRGALTSLDADIRTGGGLT